MNPEYIIRVYIAGPYSADNILQVAANMREGHNLALSAIMSMPVAVYDPWLDFHWALLHDIPMETFKRNGLAWLTASHALLLTDNWEKSSGARAERALALQLGLHVFYRIQDLHTWCERLEFQAPNIVKSGYFSYASFEKAIEDSFRQCCGCPLKVSEFEKLLTKKS